MVIARLHVGAMVRSLPERWRGLQGCVERAVQRTQAVASHVLAARAWRPRWWGGAMGWWAASPIRSAIGWWLSGLDGCLERAHSRLPGWWPEQLTPVLLVAGLAALDVEAWRSLPW